MEKIGIIICYLLGLIPLLCIIRLGVHQNGYQGCETMMKVGADQDANATVNNNVHDNFTAIAKSVRFFERVLKSLKKHNRTEEDRVKMIRWICRDKQFKFQRAISGVCKYLLTDLISHQKSGKILNEEKQVFGSTLSVIDGGSTIVKKSDVVDILHQIRGYGILIVSLTLYFLTLLFSLLLLVLAMKKCCMKAQEEVADLNILVRDLNDDECPTVFDI